MKKISRITAGVLALSMLISGSVSAAYETISDGNAKTVTINMMEKYSIMETTSGNKLNGYSWKYTTDNGIEGPAYCVNWGLKNPSSTKKLAIAGKYTASPKTVGAFAAGYPQRTLDEFIRLYSGSYPILSGLTVPEYASATQIAVWATLGQVAVQGTNFTSGRATLARPTSDLSEIRTYTALEIILSNADYWTKPLVTGLHIRLGKRELGSTMNIEHLSGLIGAEKDGAYGIKKEKIGGIEYYTRSFVVSSATSTFKHGYCIEVYAENAPDGTIFAGSDSVPLESVVWEGRTLWRVPTPKAEYTDINANGEEYAGEFKICIPVRLAGPSGDITIHATTTAAQYNIYLANNDTETEQSYIIADPMYCSLWCSGAIKWNTIKPAYGRLIVNKTDDMANPLSGAIFKLTGVDGSRFEGTSNSNGQIIWEELNPDVQYTLEEVQTPKGYLPSEPVTVSVSEGQTEVVNIRNYSMHTLRIKKIDAQNGSPLLGAVFKIEQTDGTFKTELATGHSGVLEFKGQELPLGTYKIYETKAPNGYEKDEEVRTFLWDGKNDTEIVFKNIRKPSLILIKMDKDTHESLEDAVFNVYKDGELVTSAVTDNSGYARVSGLSRGYYEVEEVTPPAGYIKDTERHGVHINPYNPATDDDPVLVITNTSKPKLIIEKLDYETLAPIEGATFEIYKDTLLLGEYKTDRYGKIELDGLDEGTYSVKETGTDSEHIPIFCPQMIELTGGKTGRLVFYNKTKPGLLIIKTDAETKQRISGAVFHIEAMSEGFSNDLATDENGEINIESLEPGTYFAKENTAPNGYIRTDEARYFELTAGGSVQVVFENHKKPDLLITKTDAQTGKTLQGAVIKITSLNDGKAFEEVTDESGEIKITACDEGIYQIEEIKAPEGYLINREVKNISVKAGKENRVILQNSKKPSLVIKKTDSITKDTLSGAKFRIVYAPDNTKTGEINDLGIFETDENGLIELYNLSDGWYQVTETQAPDGYITKSEPRELFIKEGEDKEAEFENTPLSALIIKKVDEKDGTVLSGAKFRIKSLKGTSGTGGTVIGEYETSANGTVAITRLQKGTYIVEEIQAPTGYEISEPSKTVYLTGNEQSVVTAEFKDKRYGRLVIEKVDSESGQHLSGAEFKVTTSSGELVANSGGSVSSNGIYTTDVNGQISITDIKPGETLVITETKAPTGYIKDTVSKTVKINAGDTQTITFGNKRDKSIGGIRITKLDGKSRQPISNVTFEISRIDGKRIGTFTTDKDGIILADGLENGWYTAIETKAANGYIKDSEPHNIEVKNGEITRVTLTNNKASAFLIHKVDSETGKGIYGVTFLISDKNQNPVAQYTTDQNGYVYTDSESLPDGKYYIREISVPNGYVIDNEVKTFYVEYGHTDNITWYNTPKRGQIQITKKSYDDNTVNGLKAGTLLENAVFGIFDKSGNTADTVRTDKNGRAVSKALPLGSYTVREISPPENYSINENVITAELEFAGQILNFEVLDRSVSTGVSITKRGYNEVMPDNPVVYTFSGISNQSNVPLESFYWRDTLPSAITCEKLVTGTYNRRMTYKIVYLTNLSNGEYRTINDNLSTSKNYALDISPAALGLKQGEYLTEIMFVFGQADAGFRQVETPMLYARSAVWLANGTSFVNNADVGGVYNGKWIMSTSRWVTGVYKYTNFDMPRTGY